MDEYKAWVQKNIASFTNLEYTLMEYPEANKGEIIIETKAATLNLATPSNNPILTVSYTKLRAHQTPEHGLIEVMRIKKM